MDAEKEFTGAKEYFSLRYEETMGKNQVMESFFSPAKRKNAMKK